MSGARGTKGKRETTVPACPWLAPLSSLLLPWYDRQVRALPWRDTPTPYGVWVSEIMLQQTRIEAVLSYYDRFMKAFPTIRDLADAPEDVLMKQWEGLGYYSRARNLQKTARMVRDTGLPADYEALLRLPGIGEYTAGAIASIAFGIPVPAVDGNVLRVLARLMDCDADVMKPPVRRMMTQVIAELVPPQRPGDFNQAVMELGETICLPNTDPDCKACPLAGICRGAAAGRARELPVRSAAKEKRKETRTVLVLLAADRRGTRRVLLHRRPSKGLLAGLWELPNVEGELTARQAMDWAREKGCPSVKVTVLTDAKHLFSHVEWRMRGYCVESASPPEEKEPNPDNVWASAEELREKYALPGAFRAYSRMLPQWLEEGIPLSLFTESV